MQTNSVSLDEEMAAALGECKVGETKDITLRVRVDGMDGGFTGTVENVVDYQEADSTEGEGKPVPPPKKPAPPAKRAKALQDAISSSLP